MKIMEHERRVKLSEAEEEPTLSDLAKKHNINYHTLYGRLARMSLEEALATPVMTPQQVGSHAGKAGARKRWGKTSKK